MTQQAQLKAVRRLARKCGWQLSALRLDGKYVCHLARGGGTTGEPYERITGTNRRGESRPYTLSLDEAEMRCWEMRPEFAPRVSHPLLAQLEALAEMYGGEPKDYAIMSNKSDPFLMDTDTNYAAGRWLANMIAQYGITRIHDRGLHYVLVSAGVTRPDGKPYRNDAASWAWLLEKVSAARWLGHIQFNVITDQKNADGVFRIRTTPEPKGSVATDVDMKVPGAKDVQPTVGLAGFTGTQPYRIALVGEKSSLQPVLGPIAEKYDADLLLFTGNASNTRIWELARAASNDGRPLVVLYFSDCDYWGWKMVSEVGWKLSALQVRQFGNLNFRVYRAALTPEQVLQYDLPQSPIEKGQEAEAEKWREATGVEQTEIDAIATLQPELLTQITEELIANFRDDTLDGRVSRARTRWVNQAQRVVDYAVDQPALDAAVEDITEREAEIQEVLDERVQPIIDTAEAVTLPDLPKIPAPKVDFAAEPDPLVDSDWSFADCYERLRADRHDYE